MMPIAQMGCIRSQRPHGSSGPEPKDKNTVKGLEDFLITPIGKCRLVIWIERNRFN